MMIKKLLIVLLFLQSARLQAMIDFQIFGGYRDATFEKLEQEYQLATTELGGALHLSPISKVPIAIGVSYLYLLSHDKDSLQEDTNLNIDDFEGYEVSAELYLWYNINLTKTFIMKTYLKGSYIFAGEYRFEYTNVDAKYDVTGWYAAFGIGDNFAFIPNFYAMIEAGLPLLDIYKPRFNDVEVNPVNKLSYKAWDVKLVFELAL